MPINDNATIADLRQCTTSSLHGTSSDHPHRAAQHCSIRRTLIFWRVLRPLIRLPSPVRDALAQAFVRHVGVYSRDHVKHATVRTTNGLFSDLARSLRTPAATGVVRTHFLHSVQGGAVMSTSEKRKADEEPAAPSKKIAKVAARVHPSRIRNLNTNKIKDGPVIYW